MNEAGLMHRLKADTLAYAPPRTVWCRHVDRYTSGVADVEIVCQGMTTWVEFKWLTHPQREHSRDRALLQSSLVTKLQHKFLLDRMKAGVRGYVVVGWQHWSDGHLEVGAVPAARLEGALTRNVINWCDGYMLQGPYCLRPLLGRP